jgi:hypothetical protein
MIFTLIFRRIIRTLHYFILGGLGLDREWMHPLRWPMRSH